MRGIGEAKQGLYYFCLKSILHSQIDNIVYNSQCDISLSPSCNVAICTTWHNRLGHIPFTMLKYFDVIKSGDADLTCSICPQAKQTRLPFSNSTSHTTAPFGLLHFDI